MSDLGVNRAAESSRSPKPSVRGPQQQQQPYSLADVAYDALRQDIVAGRWEPGTQLREQELAELLGMSRTPVREAVRRLQADRFLDANPSRGAVVPERGAHDLIEDYCVRAELEALAAETATDLIGDDEIKQLESLTEQSFDFVHSHDMDGYIRSNHSFHRLLVHASGNTRLVVFHELLQDAILMASAQEAIVQSKQALIAALYEHYEITNAMKHRQPERARKAARSHVLASVVWLREHIADKTSQGNDEADGQS